MPAAKLTPQQQRDRRSKIMLGVVGVVFLGVMGLQLPKLLHPGGGTPPLPAASPTAVAGAADPAALASAAAPASGQLVRFSRFAPKDPFHALVSSGVTGATGAASSATPTTATKPAPAPKPSIPAKKTTTTPSVTFSVTPTATTPAKPTGPLVPAALLLVDGKKQVLALTTAFPRRHPLFRVVAVGQNAVWIRLIGGTLSNGAQTLKLVRGRKVTLVNTTAGTRFVLALVKPTTAPPPPKPLVQPQPAPAATTTTSTTPITTTTPPSGG